MKIGIPKEVHAGEKRVATTPEVAKALAARAIRFPWALYRYLQEHDLLTSERVPSTKRPPSRRRKNDSTGSLDNSRLPY